MMDIQSGKTFAATRAREGEYEAGRAGAARAPLASIGLRCGAFLLDYILTIIVPAFTVLVALFFKRTSLGLSYGILAAGYAVTAGLVLINWVYLCGQNGQTFGKRIIGIRVVRADGALIDYKTAALRHCVGYLLAAFLFGLGLLWMLWDARQQGWHDKIAGTLVVKDEAEEAGLKEYA